MSGGLSLVFDMAGIRFFLLPDRLLSAESLALQPLMLWRPFALQCPDNCDLTDRSLQKKAEARTAAEKMGGKRTVIRNWSMS